MLSKCPVSNNLVWTDAEALELLERIRWGEHPLVCPQCGRAGRCYFLTPGAARKTRTGKDSSRRIWKCGHCRRQFSVWTGTSFARTKLRPILILIALVNLFETSEQEITPEALVQMGAERRSAFYLWYRIRYATADDPLVGKFRSLTESIKHAIDELVAAGKIEASYEFKEEAEPGLTS